MSTPEHTEKLYQFAQKLLDMSIAIIADAKIDTTELWAKDPKVLALALLSRTLTNFKGTVTLAASAITLNADIRLRCNI
jgi:hypothetical protein